MGVLRLFDGDTGREEETVEVIAAFALSNGVASNAELLKWDMDFLGLFDIVEDSIGIRFLQDRFSMSKQGLVEEDLKEYVTSGIDESGYLHHVEFEQSDYGEVIPVSKKISMVRTNARTLRNFFLVDYKGNHYITTVKGLNKGTLHYKKNSVRNTMGLQWSDLITRFL